MLKQTSLLLADDAYWKFVEREFAEVLEIIEEADVRADLIVFKDRPGAGMLILEKGAYTASMRIMRFSQKHQDDTGELFFMGQRFPSGVHGEKQVSERAQFIAAMRRQFAASSTARRAAA